jgi:hypothetical protein
MAAPVLKTVENWLVRQTAPNAAAAAGGMLGFHSVLFILGNSGTGKTHLVRTLCEAHDYDLQILHSQNCESARALADRLGKMTRTRLVQTFAGTTRPVVILIDELDTLIQMDRMMLSTLTDILHGKTLPHVALIAIGAPAQEKKLGAFKSACCQIIYCFPPSDADLFLFLRARNAALPEAAATSRIPADRLMAMAEEAGGSFHAACRLWDAAMCGGASASAGAGAGADADTANAVAPEFHSIFRATPEAVATVARVFSEDPWLAPMRFHENLIKEISNRKGLVRDKMRVYRELLQALCDWDQWMIAGVMEDSPSETAEAGGPDPSDYLARRVVGGLSELQRKKNTTVTDADLQDFTKVFSQISIQKKQERATYCATDAGFPWADAQIFYHV